jgi:hypothetical protein
MRKSEKAIAVQIKHLRKLGYSDSGIKKTLKGAGVSSALVSASFYSLQESHNFKKNLVRVLFGHVEHHPSGHKEGKLPGITLIFILFILGISTISALAYSPPSCGSDSFCFLEKAQNCENVQFNSEIKGVLFKFTASDCEVVKEVVSVDSEEEVAKIFERKAMTCTYEQGNFDMSLINSLGGVLDACGGEYKNAYVYLRDNFK